jgi:hypothetical protein
LLPFTNSQRVPLYALELAPVSRLPFYRAHVLVRMPNLRSLDGAPVHPREVGLCTLNQVDP